MTALRQRMLEDTFACVPHAVAQPLPGNAEKLRPPHRRSGPILPGQPRTFEPGGNPRIPTVSDQRASPDAVNQFVSAAKFLYHITLETPWPEGALPRCRVPHRTSGSQRHGDRRVFPARVHDSLSRRPHDGLRSRLARLRGGGLAGCLLYTSDAAATILRV